MPGRPVGALSILHARGGRFSISQRPAALDSVVRQGTVDSLARARGCSETYNVPLLLLAPNLCSSRSCSPDGPRHIRPHGFLALSL
jgi:hypothetical protein